MTASIDVSFGELVDKLTILEIKSARIEDPIKLANIRAELQALNSVWANMPTEKRSPEVLQTRLDLKRINERLWDIENSIRTHEVTKTFDSVFIELARSVYITNDERARLKRRLDALLGSRFSEEKSYQRY